MDVVTVRSFPTEPLPPRRAYVQDTLPRVLTPLGLDYGRSLADLDADGVVLLEWDIAVDGYELQAFTKRALRTPDLVSVAPFKIGIEPNRHWAMWNHRFQPVEDGDLWCYAFGFGCTYLPMAAIRGFLDARLPGADGQFTDGNFSRWWNRGAAIDWSVRPVHLHGGWDGTY